LESLLTETRPALGTERNKPELREWEPVLPRVEAYLRAWRIGDSDWARECAQEIVAAARTRISTEASSSPIQAAIDEADSFLHRWFQETAPESAREGRPDRRLALLAGASAEANFSDRTQLAAAFRQGTLNFTRALSPSRPPETRAITMQTSLSRLPSIRIIAGWLLLIALLFVAFLLTHHHPLIR
jgi:hypothetical protein